MTTCFPHLRKYVLLMLILLPACSSVRAPSSVPSPLFVADPGDIERYQALVQRQKKMFPDCAEPSACAHGHFTRALVTLFEDRETATKHFQEVVEVAPKSRLASSSKLWIKLIRNQGRTVLWNRVLDSVRLSGESNELLVWSTEQLVRDLLEREMVIQQLLRRKQHDAASLRALQRELSERGKKLEHIARERGAKKARKAERGQPSVKELRRQLAIRDRKIQELSSQLDALKRIDQEMREFRKPPKPLRPAGDQ